MSSSIHREQAVGTPTPRVSPEHSAVQAPPTPTPTPNRQLVLPGQAAAPDGPVEMSGMFLMHFAFRRDLSAFTAAVGATPLADRATWSALVRRWRSFANVLHKHHSAEDAGLWPLLIERAEAAGDAQGSVTLHAMATEHHGIDPLLGSCSRALARLASTSEEGVHRKLAKDLAALGERLHAHLAHEETDALTLVQTYLTQEDWERLDKEYFSKGYKPWDLPFALCWVLHRLPEEAQQFVFSIPAAPPRKAWNLLRPGFERRERKAFRYVPEFS